MLSLRVVRPSGAELPPLELEASKTILDAKSTISDLSGVPVAEQKLLLNEAELENHTVLGSVPGLHLSDATLTLIHELMPPWCWPQQGVPLHFTQCGVHKFELFEDPEERVDEVFYPSEWDEEFDQTVKEKWRRRGLRLTPGLGVHAGKELSFEYGVDGDFQSITLGTDKHRCGVHHSNQKGSEVFVLKCLEIALRLSQDRAWPREALEKSVLVQADAEGFADNFVTVNVRALATPGEAESGNIAVHVEKQATFTELHHAVAAALFHEGRHYSEGFALWSADGTALMPIGNLRFLQPALHPDGDTSFSCIAVPRSVAAVAVAGVGIFPIASAPARTDGTARVGFCISPWGGKARALPGMDTILNLAHGGSSGHGRRGGMHADGTVVHTALSDLPETLAAADDLCHMQDPQPGSVVQLFEISSVGVMQTVVRATGDNNMVGGSYNVMVVPADANSKVIRHFLTLSVTRGSSSCGWSRLATAQDHGTTVKFDQLLEFSKTPGYDGLCICHASRNER